MTVEEWLGKDNILGQDIWHKKYQHNNETFDEWLDRVSGDNEDVRECIKNKDFLFGGRILSNRGVTDTKSSLSNCYVIPAPEDNLESIYECRKQLARTYSYGGGCGIDISKLAPKGSRVRNQANESSGAVSFMQGFSQTTEEVCQSGRRGALMISISCDHPDLIDFINIKTSPDSVTKANISVRVTNDFMRAVIEDKDWEMSFTREETGQTITKVMKAKEIFRILCQNNSDWAEPGILYWDTVENWNLLSNNPNFSFAGVNPCAEEPLPEYGACLLGSINLNNFVAWNQFDFNRFSHVISIAVIALNDVLDEGIARHPLEQQKRTARDWRQIGLGIMGLADMLINLGIKYDSEEAMELCNKIGSCLINTALITSSFLASTQGTYPKYDESVLKTPFFSSVANNETVNLVTKYGLRNSQLLTIAPTGTLSTMLGISGGVEPIFANYYERKTESLHGSDTYYKVYTPIVKNYMELNNISDDKDLPDYFVTSGNIDPFMRIKMQATWQKYIDASISSTINLPNDTDVETIEKIYIDAWKNSLKGLTIFRSGCKREAVLSVEKPKEDKVENSNKLERGYIIQCSPDLIGKKRKLQTGCGSLHVLGFFDPVTGDLQEVYFNKGSTGGCANFMVGLSRMISLLCRAGVSIYDIKDQLDSTGACPSYAVRSATKHDTSKGACCPMAIGNALVDMYNEMKDDLFWDEDTDKTVSSDISPALKEVSSPSKCPECGNVIRHEGGCDICPSCGWSH
ncbi:MAG: adenosylcobalamin-dependent ribonucleoside-diphosphate reductase, partial [Clostridium sp.]|nr:adenosylcobalamin-dependent ribonucleoside-diphosphate reductase [Clostridium sp.]